ncbi:hypothetical protein CT0861_06322 [Colletotrichum tofieldiae]|uniref:Uncharacterized protein n=1 Tax=Colletotrichum tofieldiae TaxID=708197 RepID=A0A161VNA2_9PEZI|nr:hypothetical protein CT0861_06322 [Colletotrichum tofieldiae]
MSKIIRKKLLGSVLTSSGNSVTISAATRTTNWVRTDSAAESMKEALEAAIEKNEGILPAGTAEVCTRETTHTSASDSRSHITAVCFDSNGDRIKTVHLPTSNA